MLLAAISLLAQGTVETIGVSGAVVTVALAGYKALTVMAAKKNGNGNGHATVRLSDEDRDALHAAAEVLSRTDEEGRPMVYFPRYVVKLMADQTSLMREQTALLSQMRQRLNEHEKVDEERFADILKRLPVKPDVRHEV